MNNNPISPALIAELVALARRAGDAIMAIYAQEDSYDITHKGDESPLTAADLAAQRVIAAGLPGLLDVPIISEEAALPDFSVRQGWSNYWLVDPLDGTKEFIARNGQFTVNIALVQQGRPLLGVVHVPTSDTTYLGVLAAQQPESLGAWKYTAGHSPQAIRVRDLEARAAAQFREDRIPKFLGYFEEALANRDWMAGGRWSPVDTSLFQMVAGLRYMFPKRMAAIEGDYPALIALHDRVTSLPGIAAYLDSDRRQPFNEDGIFRHYPELDAA